DEVFVVNFNDEAFLDVPFTSDIHKMEQGLAKIDSRGGTAMRDAVTSYIAEVRGRTFPTEQQSASIDPAVIQALRDEPID
ncbi:MAG: hypothetical protein ACXVA4_06885, partial [Ktedonobacterales bacterium]